jgi:hypothetical protein
MRVRLAPMAESLRELQFRFAAHLRDPQRQPPPAQIDPRRLQVYRELYFNNIQSLLAANFPVIASTLGEERWLPLVRAFCREHCAHTPLFPEIGQEFIHFLDQQPVRADAPWLLELAHYEWIELALKISDAPLPAHDPAGDLLAQAPVLSPWCRALAYTWPVHRIAPDYHYSRRHSPRCCWHAASPTARLSFRSCRPCCTGCWNGWSSCRDGVAASTCRSWRQRPGSMRTRRSWTMPRRCCGNCPPAAALSAPPRRPEPRALQPPAHGQAKCSATLLR